MTNEPQETPPQPKPEKYQGGRLIDWEVVKGAYLLDGESTIKSIADKFEISYPVAMRKSREEGWYELRTKLAEHATALTLRTTADALNKLRAEVSKKAQRRSEAWSYIQSLVLEWIQDRKERGLSISATDLLRCVQSFDIATKGERLEDGQPTSISKSAMLSAQVDGEGNVTSVQFTIKRGEHYLLQDVQPINSPDETVVAEITEQNV